MNNDGESNFYIENLFEETNNMVTTQDQVKENIKQIFSTLTEQFKEELRISELKPTKLGKGNEIKRKYRQKINFSKIQYNVINVTKWVIMQVDVKNLIRKTKEIIIKEIIIEL
jgi:hypothetical protein